MSADPGAVGRAGPRDETNEIAANLRAGITLWLAGTVFVFLPPIFAWFYLKTMNSEDLWKPAGVSAPFGFGLAIMGIFVASAAVLGLAALLRSGSAWKGLVACSLLLGLAGVALQVVEYTQLDFGATSGGYANAFYAGTIVTATVALATMVWLETLLAYGLRHPDAPAAVVHPRLVSLAVYWSFVAFMGVLVWLLLYVLSW